MDVIPESSADSGRPDIVIKCENEQRIAIENKIDAAFTVNQIERYKAEFKYVFLIYRYLSEPAQANYATDSFTWYKIYSATKSYIEQLPDNYNVINKYLLNQFLAHLEDTNMGAEKVSWEILEGTRSLFNLYTQIQEALERLKGRKLIGKYKMGGTGVWYVGWQLLLDKKEDFNVYVHHYPFRFFSGFYDKDDWSSKYKRIREMYPDLNWVNWYFLDELDFNKTHFLCFSVDEQVNTIVEFLEHSIQKYWGK